MNEMSELAAFVSGLKWSDVPEEVKKAAVFHVLDSVGAALGAAGNQQVQRVLGEWSRRDQTERISVWGQNRKMSLGTAVFINAMMGHTLEMDDVHTNSKTHIGTVVIPAAWGMAEELGASGKEFLLAVICGYEVMSRIGMAFGVTSHRNRGWHVTATAGTFGAAAACAKLSGLDAGQTANALGLAGAQSFGTWAFLGDGATCKVLNPARAAQVGMESALLAKAGMTGPVHILTAGDGGLLSMMSDQADPGLAAKDLGSVWQSLFMDNKPYPSCRSTHCTIDGTLALCRNHGITAEAVEHAEVETYLVGYKQCGVSEGSITPETVVNAKFSTPFTVACAILYGEVSMKQFTQEVIDRPEVKELLKRVTVRPTDEFSSVYPQHWGCRVRIFTRDGKCYEQYVKDASGSVDNPLNAEQVRAKAAALMEETCKERTAGLVETLLAMEHLEQLPQL